ncbi:uncharacterized protein METZ01_LOCUS498053, partial [marine metagenome]
VASLLELFLNIRTERAHCFVLRRKYLV